MSRVYKHSNWFKEWFNSPYYHILYQHRDDNEAKLFIDNLLVYLKPSYHVKFLDIACGKGRHAIYLNRLGYSVTGIDICEQSIKYAKQFENKNLDFFMHDMREVFQPNKYDYVFNLFTSFGYFEDENDNYIAIKAITKNLKPEGILILDFMNVTKTIANLVKKEDTYIDGIAFNINRWVEDGFIIKQINFTAQEKKHSYQERVKAITFNEFKEYFNFCRLNIVDLFGDYQLNPFDEKKSERLILIVKKS